MSGISRKKIHVHEPAIKCICKSIPFEVTAAGTDVNIFQNPEGLFSSGIYTVVNLTDTTMTVVFHTATDTTGVVVPPGGSITMQLNNLTRIDVNGVTSADGEDGRLDFEICFPVDFPRVV